MNSAASGSSTEWVERLAHAEPFASRALPPALFIGLALVHLVFVVLNTAPATWDEAHYLLGAVQWQEALRSGRHSSIWHTYVSLLGYKPPLISLAAGMVMCFFGSGQSGGTIAGVIIFALLGYAAWRFFRRLFSWSLAAFCALLLLTSPMITGLTHYLYPEGLLLLLMLAYLNLLLAHGWTTWRSALLLGAVLGAGMLTKSTFAVTVAVPSVYLLIHHLRTRPQGRGLFNEAGALAARVSASAAIAALLAGPWYFVNSAAVLAHSQAAFWCDACRYPLLRSLFALTTSGTYFFTAVLALVGILFLAGALLRRTLEGAALHAWVLLLLVTVVTLIAWLVSPNKSLRLAAPLLPAAAAFAVVALVRMLKSARALRAGVYVVSFVSLVLVLHNSFGILPWGTLRYYDITLLSGRFPLDVPHWRDSNAPLDRQQYPLAAAARFITVDARKRFGQNRPVVMLTADCPYFNHNLFEFLARGRGANYLPWGYFPIEGERQPQYLLYLEGAQPYCFGALHKDGGQAVRELRQNGRLAYTSLKRLAGPQGSAVEVLLRARTVTRRQHPFTPPCHPEEA